MRDTSMVSGVVVLFLTVAASAADERKVAPTGPTPQVRQGTVLEIDPAVAAALQPIASIDFGGGSNEREGGQNVTVQVFLKAPAPAGGVQVNVTSNQPALLPLPATMTVQPGAPWAGVTVTSVAPAADTTITVSASANRAAQPVTRSLTLKGTFARALTADNSSITVGGTKTLTLLLSGAAPAGGAVAHIDYYGHSGNATLTESQLGRPMLSHPTTVTVAAGATTASFAVNHVGGGWGPNDSAEVRAGYNGRTASAFVNEFRPGTGNPPLFSKIEVVPSQLVGGGTAKLRVTLTQNLPALRTFGLIGFPGFKVEVGGEARQLSNNPVRFALNAFERTQEIDLTTTAVASTTGIVLRITDPPAQPSAVQPDGPALGATFVTLTPGFNLPRIDGPIRRDDIRQITPQQ